MQFARFFLDRCLDQANFMVRMTEFDGIAGRLSDLLRFLDSNPWTVGSEKLVIKPEASALTMEFVTLGRAVARGAEPRHGSPR